MNIELNLPDVLAPFKEKIIASAKPFVRISPKNVGETTYHIKKL